VTALTTGGQEASFSERLRELKDQLAQLRDRLSQAELYLGMEELRKRFDELSIAVSAPDLWDDPEKARELTTEYGRAQESIDRMAALTRRLEDAQTLAELAGESEDPKEASQLAEELQGEVNQLDVDLGKLELASLLSGPYDEHDAIVEYHAGAGGTDAQDWVEMLVRMHQRWAETRGFQVAVDDVSPGQEAGLLSATLIVRGPSAFGLLRGEHGVHRLVRISPFDSQHRRHTSFALVEVRPLTSEDVEVEIDEDKDLRIDTYRSSGAGGQHVNVTDSAVRITHLPTGIVVTCQNERSQHQNKARAMEILRSKLAERKREEQKAAQDALVGPHVDAAWGNQIRSYVLAPYQLVKDLRTQHETGNVEGVLAGDLDPFMESFLRWQRANATE
jgi:peptide chain release factor 2